ncbi:MAG TPA: CbtA family protein [Hansschlegelia sp.]
MTGTLLLRGMLVGLVAGLLCFGFLKIAGEPAVDRAIAFEARTAEAHEHAPAGATAAHEHADDEHEHELVSRPVQAGVGLLTGVVVFAASLGGLFALTFAFVHGRFGDSGPRATAAFIAIAGFVSVGLVPFLKYPANPPAVGDPSTLGMRTSLYFAMIAISLAAMIGTALLQRHLSSRMSVWNASVIAALSYIVVMIVVAAGLPGVNEVPEQFPAVVLWQFRLSSIGAQLLMWTTIGLLFGLLTERAAAGVRRAPLRASTV